MIPCLGVWFCQHTSKGYNTIFLTYKSSIYYSTYNNDLYEFNADTGIETKVDKPLGNAQNINENIFLTGSIKQGSKVVDLDNDKHIIKELPRLSWNAISSSFIIGQIGRNGNEIIVYDMHNDTSYTIATETSLKQIINIKDEFILLYYKDKSIRCIDIHTQQEVWHTQVLDMVDNRECVEHSFARLIYCEQKDIVYLFAEEYSFELQLNGTHEPEISVKRYKKDTDTKWYFKESRIYNDYITFTAGIKPGMAGMFIGLIDRKTMEIVWTAKSHSDWSFSEAPQLKDNKLYALNNDKTLYIYERE